ncbi:type I DNA topoisomerase [Candidatus Microgenomates bacterium]|nr:MAG: type I DNA topoisomerase [Candidatus Microgenomates bacterium]
MMNLVIVESPTKAKTIGRFLGKDYEIRASMGHLLDLPKSTLGVDVEHNFQPDFELVKDKQKIISDLKSLAKKADNIILATDPDREGEAIASHVKDVLSSSSKFKGQNSKFTRIVFHEITKEAIEEALKNPRSIDKNLVEAQTARRVLDRLVGYKLSPLLWQKVRRGLSAGRVQSVALRLIVEREREIEKFKKEEYWTIQALLAAGPAARQPQNLPTPLTSAGPHSGAPRLASPAKNATEFELIEINGEKIETQETFNLYDGEYRITKTVIGNEEKAKKIAEDLKTRQFTVSDVIQKETRRSPLPPFTTSTLQQDASRRFGFSGKRTMGLAQKLYEEGFITYHRTDSLNVSVSAINSMRDFAKKEFGEKYVPQEPRIYKTKQKSAQEAHEAIRPTKISNLESLIQQEVGRDYAKIYGLIWRRALASQMSDAIIESTTVIVDSDKKENIYKLKTNGSVLVFEGFLKVNPQALQDKRLPEFKTAEELKAVDVLEQKHETTPPPRYNDASLIKTLEEKGIGRPSTYATIVSTIEGRQYIERAEGRFTPTTVGNAVNDFLVTNFSDIDDIPFTAEMEDHLDSIASGEKDWVPMIKDFYTPFSKKLKEVKDAKRVKIEVEETDEKCEKCQAPMVVRIGRFGKFLSCSDFPDCKFSKPYLEDTGLLCPKDGGKIIVRKTKKGRKFYGCSNYPKCDFAAWKLEDIKKDSKQPNKDSKQEEQKTTPESKK